MGLLLFLLGWVKGGALLELEDHSVQYPWPLTPGPLGQSLCHSWGSRFQGPTAPVAALGEALDVLEPKLILIHNEELTPALWDWQGWWVT